MKIYKKVERIQNSECDCICNKCGKSQLYGKDDGARDTYGLTAYFTTGFFSKSFPDCMEYEFSLCEECLAELFKTFKYEPNTNEYL